MWRFTATWLQRLPSRPSSSARAEPPRLGADRRSRRHLPPAPWWTGSPAGVTARHPPAPPAPTPAQSPSIVQTRFVSPHLRGEQGDYLGHGQTDAGGRHKPGLVGLRCWEADRVVILANIVHDVGQSLPGWNSPSQVETVVVTSPAKLVDELASVLAL